MVKVVGVRFKRAGKIYYFDPGDIDVKLNDFVIVETARGIEFGHVVVGPKEVPEEEIVAPLKNVIRVATDEDFEIHRENRRKAKEALAICEKKVEEHGLEMKLVDVEYTFDNNKVIFYFTADGRVDFRELVKDLAAIFKTRIELRQIGVRDEAKMIGGLGPCGKPVCCAQFLGEFEPVSIKMAKEQNLSLNPTKISGLCGRLMCCLKFEHQVYEELLQKMPKIGAIVNTPEGKGTVIETFTLLEKVKVKVRLPDMTDDVFLFHINDIEDTGEMDPAYEKSGEAAELPATEEANIEELEESEFNEVSGLDDVNDDENGEKDLHYVSEEREINEEVQAENQEAHQIENEVTESETSEIILADDEETEVIEEIYEDNAIIEDKVANVQELESDEKRDINNENDKDDEEVEDKD